MLAANSHEMAILLEQRQLFLDEGAPSLEKRKENLKKLRKLVLTHQSEIERVIDSDFGVRSSYETAIMEVLGVVQTINYLLQHLKTFMRPERRRVGANFQFGSAYIQYQPKGIVGIISPWNYPCSLSLIPLATALAAGNRVMLKPSELTPNTSLFLKEMIAKEFPSSEIAFVLGDASVGAAFSGLPFDHLFFTGSTEVGRLVMQSASQHLVPLTLELGGKSPVIIAPGSVDEMAVESIIFGKLANAGQTCVAPDYLFVHHSEVDRLVQMTHETVKKFYPQGPLSANYSSIISERHYTRLLGLLKNAQDLNAEVIPLGVCPEEAGSRVRTIAPHILLNVPPNTQIMQEEIFGPLLPVCVYHHIDEVIQHINARPRPLALYYFGPNDSHRKQVLTRTCSGNVGINNTLIHVAIDDLPFGGIGASGMGSYHGIEGFRTFSHAKGIYQQRRWGVPRLLLPPYGRFADFVLRMNLKGKGKSQVL